MKKLFIIIPVLTLLAFSGEQYMKAMQASVAVSDTAATAATLQKLSNQFQRIANVEKSEWLPYYYAAYCISGSAFVQKDKNKLDEYLDNAEALIHVADSLMPNNSEIYTIKALINQGRIAVSPMTRGRKYGTIANGFIDKAMELDSTNPRPYVLRGTALFYTPPMFGGGKDKAKPLLQKALVRYESFKPSSDIMPHWGKDRAIALLEECKK